MSRTPATPLRSTRRPNASPWWPSSRAAIPTRASSFPAARLRSIFDERPEAEFALRLLESLGVAKGRVVAEDKSRNTVENARFSRELAQPKPGERWLLVTSAYHLPRAVGIFRKAGFPVEAYPVDWRTRGTGDALRPFPTMGEGLRRTDTAMREWIGLAAYWVTGQTSELFPGPTRLGECDRAAAGGLDSCRP